jgi:hypothetical protein
MQSNLAPDYRNHYYRVTQRFPVLVRVGHRESNTYFGASMVLGVVYRQVIAKPGDEIHALVGGTFLVTAKQAHEATMHITEKHPFEKVYFPVVEQWPLASLAEIPAGRKVASYRADLPRLSGAAAGRVLSNGVDALVGRSK